MGEKCKSQSLPHTRSVEEESGCSGEKAGREKVKFEIYGEEIIEKVVNSSGSCGRVYLPLGWLGKPVKIIRL